MDLARAILLRVEETPTATGWVALEFPGLSQEEVSYHVMLLAQAGLLEAGDLRTMTSYTWKPKRLTWAGHEFLDAARSETVWKKATSMMKEKGLGVGFEVLKDVLVSVAKQQLG